MKIAFTKQSGIYTLKSEQFLNISLKEAWDFFTIPGNLDQITPKEMNFHITNNPGSETYQGQIITYKIGILPFIKSNWITEITHLKKPSQLENELGKGFFVDEQRFGPYAMWHHEHHFQEINDGKILMTDLVNFKMPFGIFGDLFLGNTVKNKVKFIFESRFQILNKFFNK